MDYREEINVSTAKFNLGNIIAVSATYGWRTTKNRTIVRNAVFVEWVEQKISSIVTIVACALTKVYTPIITARVENINQTVLFVKNSFSALGARLTKCPVVMRFIGNASGS